MHLEVMRFVEETKNALPQYFNNARVLEIGSRTIELPYQPEENLIITQPLIKPYFQNCEYIGVDISEGHNVDVVCKGHEFKSDELFDTIISCECFEHDPFWELTIQNMIDHLKWNGLLIFTCASTGRSEHGTQRSDPNASPATVEIEGWQDYYKNLTKEDFTNQIPAFTNGTLVGNYWVSNEATHDLYYRGWKR